MAEEVNTPNEAENKAVVSGHSRSFSGRKFWIILVLVLVVALAIVVYISRKNEPAATVQPAFTQAQTASVSIKAAGFDPATLQIKTGTIVTWTNTDNTGHSVVSNADPTNSHLADLKSDPLIKGQVYHYKFLKAGTYNYHDGQNLTNNATVVVK